MAALEIEGRIKLKLGRQSGQSARGGWTKQEFVLTYMDGNYPADICITAFGDDKVAELDKFQVNDQVKVSFNLRGREFNGRWYNDIRLWRIVPAGGAGEQAAPRAYDVPSQKVTQAPAASYGSPYKQAPADYQAAPAPSIDDMPADDGSDDLPF